VASSCKTTGTLWRAGFMRDRATASRGRAPAVGQCRGGKTCDRRRNIRSPTSLHAQVAALAVAERRSFSKTALLLIEDAITARPEQEAISDAEVERLAYLCRATVAGDPSLISEEAS
jgi:hypothetical protein